MLKHILFFRILVPLIYIVVNIDFPIIYLVKWLSLLWVGIPIIRYVFLNLFSFKVRPLSCVRISILHLQRDRCNLFVYNIFNKRFYQHPIYQFRSLLHLSLFVYPFITHFASYNSCFDKSLYYPQMTTLDCSIDSSIMITRL
jgi:hypothetical protein